MGEIRRVLFIFLDGVGVGSPDPALNPFLQARLPNLRSLLGDTIPTMEEGSRTCDPITHEQTTAFPLDPLMGVDGLPQSGTGQTALFTGQNAAVKYGRHFGPWVPVPLRPAMMDENILSRARRKGVRCAFANAYPRQYMHLAWTKRPAGPPLAAHGADLLTRDENHLARGHAIASEILNTAWRERLGLSHVPEVTPEEAGMNLGSIASENELTLFAHYFTDTAGHERSMAAGIASLERVDAFLGGVLAALRSPTLLVLASDHGNIEDVSQGHTRNPTFNLVSGPGAAVDVSGLSHITDLAGFVLRYLAVED
jgi:hypothetical protein